jgi:N utilization substance protein A
MKLDARFTAAIQEIETSRGITRASIVAALEDGVRAAYEKSYGPAANLAVDINLQSGVIEAYLAKKVVEDMSDPNTEIDLERAQEIDPEAELGDEVEIEVDINALGNLAIHTFKQRVRTLIRDAERDKILALYSNRLYEMINCTVLYTERGDLYVETPDKIEGIVPYKEQIPRERPNPGARIKCLLVEVRNVRKAPMLVFSRTHNDLLRELMKNEIPEVREGNIEIVAISRDPGYRAKVAVRSKLPELDPVGSCIGTRGIRITAISHDVFDEKIDLVQYREDPFEFIAEALSPAKVMSVEIFEDDRVAWVVVPDDQISLAIGKGWRNVKLASKLTRYKLDVKSVTEMNTEAAQGGGTREYDEDEDDYYDEEPAVTFTEAAGGGKGAAEAAGHDNGADAAADAATEEEAEEEPADGAE